MFTIDFENLPWLAYIGQIVDILLVTYVVYKLIMIIRGTRAVQLVKGIAVIFMIWFVSNFLGLSTLEFITKQTATFGLLAIIIIFQPELRRGLEQLGRSRLFTSRSAPKNDSMQTTIDALVKATSYMGKRRIGALVSIEKETGLNDYAETGIPMQAVLTSELLINIFIPNTPLHDGAVVIKNDKILAAGCYLPLSEDNTISKELGTRHRAALGISEVTDCLTLIVSEETGGISISKSGTLYRNLSEEQLREMLEQNLLRATSSEHRWQWGVRKNG
ncbi:diadenylate cyclase CdaA [Shouchella clausii]|jgi:diadenylate cyclase|uniref:Diadenylate cyclase n=2 Tax=Shouchella clausii TaxID=79880 RepID=A0A268S833_SHOCL|nr:diadenylate cyclase CdaA [Shouchella clausii]PAD42096.1 TIGR00159 family protein [Bacillus sp. 7520-S]MEB5472000.1 diadenylate cyclase CdaA [Shouchella clausii]MED4160878.1 diadenylate cyclase CdaA [Shouchella clausii]MED4178369.1 diadenylate cyclase CdaA [Shouchella clausii]PAD07854.1 TIGR00159 family protein [Shouchella clausii]